MEPDVRWSIVLEASSFEDFKRNYLPRTELYLDIDDALKNHYEVTKKLIIHSYYEYEFITVALRNALLLYELTLNHYYQKITREECKLMLVKTIQWFANKNLIPNEEEKEILHLIRLIRNHHFHPYTHHIDSPAVITIIDMIVNWINKLHVRVSELKKGKVR